MKDIRDYLHLYLGCEVVYTGSDIFGDTAIFLERLRHSRRDEVGIRQDGYEDVSYVFSADVKPILRPLSDMTEEEAVDIAIIMYGKPDSVKWRMEDKGDFFNVYRKHYSESFTIDKASGDIDRYSKCDGKLELETTLQHHFITKYLLSRYFDLFGLIDSGLAIDKTKLK